MTCVAVAEATRHLGIDAKTLHRWLEDAQLPLQNHPRDGRKKGISLHHLQVLARQPQRSLALLPEVPPAPVKSQGPELSAELLALPEQLSALPIQISALQQQVADLPLLLQHQVHPPARAPSTPQNKASKRTPQPAPHPRPTTKPPRKPVHVIPRVEYGAQGRYVVICPKHGLLPLEPDTPEWFAWLAEQDSFRFGGQLGRFTAHHAWRVPKGAWRAYRHIRNHNDILRLAPNHDLTPQVLEQAAEALQAHLTSPHT